MSAGLARTMRPATSCAIPPYQLKPGSQIGYVRRRGSVSGAGLAVRCSAGFLAKTALARAARHRKR